MHILDQRLIGSGMLLLLMVLVIVKYMATGSIVKDKPKGGFGLWLINLFNLFFLLIANPLAAILLLTRQMEMVDPTRITVGFPRLLAVLEAFGMILYVLGYLLMAWSLLTLKEKYQAGGSPPRTSDELVSSGPYRYIRHPMYASVLFISLGLAGITQSYAYLSIYCIYQVLIVLLIPVEEAGLRRAYGERYEAFRQKTKKLIPFIY